MEEPKLQQNEKTTNLSLGRKLPLILLIVAVGLAGFSVLLVVAQRPADTDPEQPFVLLEIPRGMSGQKISARLEEEGLVAHAGLFQLLLRVQGAAGSLQAGLYRLHPSMLPTDIIAILKSGRSPGAVVTIPEGFELKQIAARLQNQGIVDGDRFLAVASDYTLVYGDEPPLAFPIPSLEGYLFPATYQFFPEQSEEAVIQQMVARLLEVVEKQVAPELETSGFSLHELLTLASIVEKEVRVGEERTKVAAVYLNRLAINMRLQADPTVRYVMTEDRDRVLYRDLEIESPYNTYRNAGLPPGPIASPGVASMLAVLNPDSVDYLFFVARRDGTHQFSHTFDEHVQARRDLGY